jgi:glutathione S-transferase
MGKVPVLTVGEKGQETTLFESHVILEFLNETSTTNLHPADPVQKARHRAVMEFGSGMIGNSWMLMIAKDQDSFITHKGALLQNLNQLETMHKAAGAGPYFAGEALHLLDISFAPLLQRLHILQNHFVPDLWQHAPTVKAWWDALNALPAMARSAIPDLETQILDRLHQENSFITTQATA